MDRFDARSRQRERYYDEDTDDNRGRFGREAIRESSYDRGDYEREPMSGRDYPGRRGRRDSGYARDPYMQGGYAGDRARYDGAYESGNYGDQTYGTEYAPDYERERRSSGGYDGRGWDGQIPDENASRPGGRNREQFSSPIGEGRHAGRGPKGYERSSERITEDVCDRLTWSGNLDASNIEVKVNGDEVTLEGTVDTREAKRMAENLAESATGVRDVHNRLQIKQNNEGTSSAKQARTKSTSSKKSTAS